MQGKKLHPEDKELTIDQAFEIAALGWDGKCHALPANVVPPMYPPGRWAPGSLGVPETALALQVQQYTPIPP